MIPVQPEDPPPGLHKRIFPPTLREQHLLRRFVVRVFDGAVKFDDHPGFSIGEVCPEEARSRRDLHLWLECGQTERAEQQPGPGLPGRFRSRIQNLQQVRSAPAPARDMAFLQQPPHGGQ
ncbi:hypothetical protein NicSoilB11_29360 [Arthrobacter sp. NicSoilB11]|nr:hypothetical protein NicSoilB11_29360 [Arthrobacter sp. NicSoilB11]